MAIRSSLLFLVSMLLASACNLIKFEGSEGSSETSQSYPSSVTLHPDFKTPSVRKSPVYIVSGLAAGMDVTLYSDSNCTTVLASGTAVTSQLEIEVPGLTQATTHFYAKTSSSSWASSCSSQLATYDLLICPSGYVGVSANEAMGTSQDFCIMKYEAKDLSGTATSTASASPWVQISSSDAKSECSSLNSPGDTNYNLPTNPEWMTVAREIELNDDNWVAGKLNRGWSRSASDGGGNTSAAPVTDSSCLYNSAANTCAASGTHTFKRTHYLQSGEEIWDIAGNVFEFIDFPTTTSQRAYEASHGGLHWDFIDWKRVDANIGAGSVMEPIVWKPFYDTRNASDGLGGYVSDGGLDTSALRGGGWDNGAGVGIYSLALGYSFSNANFGFRCVYRFP